MAINPQEIRDPSEVYGILSEVITVDRDRFFALYERGGAYAEVAYRMTAAEADAVQALDIPGVMTYKQRWRYYPGGETAAHLLGFVGFDGDDLSGRYGLERVHDTVLDRPQNMYRVNSFAELFGNIAQGFSAERSSGTGNIVTTVEPTVQAFLERVLMDLEEQWGSSQMGGVVIDPRTGAVRALAARPTFDPNQYSRADSSSFTNPLVQSVFEMGSVVKPLTIAAGIDAGVVTPESTYNDRGSIFIDGYRISNHDGRARGEITMQQVLNDSVNTGVVHVVEQMGTDLFADYMRRFGFGSKTGIDLPLEAENLVRNFESPRALEFATASFGQGIAITPIGMARALSVLANGGTLVEPYVVERVEYDNGEVLEREKEGDDGDRRVIREESSRMITRMLVATVDDALLHGTVALPRYSVAAKTGTAQIAHSDERGYREDVFLHSFFGYFPAYDPEFLVFLYHLEPQGASYASQTLTEPFMDITTFLLQYYSIAPDR